jgi:hypothetical protein
MVNRRGWIRIVEAFVAILLVAGVFLVVVNKGYIEKEDISSDVYDAQLSILREIQLNDELRDEILNVPASSLPLEGGESFPPLTQDRIEERTPNYLECRPVLCGVSGACELTNPRSRDIYAQSVIITVSFQTDPAENLSPRKLKLFCWTK